MVTDLVEPRHTSIACVVRPPLTRDWFALCAANRKLPKRNPVISTASESRPYRASPCALPPVSASDRSKRCSFRRFPCGVVAVSIMPQLACVLEFGTPLSKRPRQVLPFRSSRSGTRAASNSPHSCPSSATRPLVEPVSRVAAELPSPSCVRAPLAVVAFVPPLAEVQTYRVQVLSSSGTSDPPSNSPVERLESSAPALLENRPYRLPSSATSLRWQCQRCVQRRRSPIPSRRPNTAADRRSQPVPRKSVGCPACTLVSAIGSVPSRS